MNKKNYLLTGVVLCLVFMGAVCFSNNVTVSNVELKAATASTVKVEFDISQQNPFGDLTDANSAVFSDYIWVFIKFDTDVSNEEVLGWKHATLVQAGSSTQFSVAADGKGAFIKANNCAADLTLVWNFQADGVVSTNTVKVKVMSIEMVYVPQGQFVYNVGNIGTNSFNNYNNGVQATISATTNVPSGASDGWPNGFRPFYIMKGEVSQGQYADFLNAISATDAGNRYAGSFSSWEYAFTYTGGNPYGSRYAASKPNRACNFLSWDDAKAYASWCALRPMTEMEFEKAARGGGTNTNTYPWGNTDPATGNSLYTPSGHSAPYDAFKYYCNYYDNTNNTDGQDGPTNVGNYLSNDMVRTNAQTGASPYGIADLAGNLWEHLINCAWTTIPGNGNGTVTPPVTWPDAAAGKGVRGGGWGGVATYLRVSDRDSAGDAGAGRDGDIGFRAARTP